jgi:hypothetical protein
MLAPKQTCVAQRGAILTSAEAEAHPDRPDFVRWEAQSKADLLDGLAPPIW